MAAFEFNLLEPPNDPRQRELWLQHAIGFILFQDVRDYALQQIDASLKDDEKSAAIKAINDAVYGLMMVLDGVTGSLSNESRRVNLRVFAELVDVKTDEVVESLDLMDGDGMCRGTMDGLRMILAISLRSLRSRTQKKTGNNQAMHASRRSAANFNHSFLAATA